MTNIPTEILRTLTAVIDHGSFTKAAVELDLTQPAVSAQMKRLVTLLGHDVFDRSTPGVLKLTPQGELVVGYARRLLSINDQIMHIGSRPELVIRVGTPSDFIGSLLPAKLAQFRKRWPDVRFIVRRGFFDALVRELRSGELDILVGLSLDRPHDARYTWPLETVWARGATTAYDPNRPVPLVTYGEGCVYHHLATETLTKARLDWEAVFTGASIMSLANAVTAGLGIMAMIRRPAIEFGMIPWDDAPLPKLASLHSGIYIREGGARAAYEQLADEIFEMINPQAAARPATGFSGRAVGSPDR
ncbi:MAG TPA: LysR family transcriptional regulator [Pseudolabrys sp.]|nr:LysR family transcriptional regulator [Pseudolabrys sp.]